MPGAYPLSKPSILSAALADRYTMERELGAGGMATVYLARDLKHDRLVALKVLKPELAAVIGADRFLSEIKTTANLQHPHILALFDSGTVNGTVFYAMPYIDGESLRDKLTREKQLPIDEALRIAREVADALQYAHERGVIHRDIKPENILLQGGHALVADFGIALAANNIGGTRMTETGMSLGTPTYMSPEQAMGERTLDARTDIYALGCVTYEMLAGEAPFSGTTAQAIVAKVLTEKPASIIARRDRVPPQVEDAVLTALEKLPADRFATAAQFAEALAGTTITKGVRARVAPRHSVSSAGQKVLYGSAALTLAAFTFFVGARFARAGDLPIAGFGGSTKITFEPGVETLPAISPDGKSVAYVAGVGNDWRIHLRQVVGGRTVRLTNDSTNVESNPQWSADGSRILFLSRGGAFSASAAGGDVRPEIPGGTSAWITSATWSPDGKQIAYVVGDSLLLWEEQRQKRVIAVGRDLRRCTWNADATLIACGFGNASYLDPSVLLFGNLAPSRIAVIRVSDGQMFLASDSTSINHSPIWSPDGHWVYFVSSQDGPRDVYASRVSSSGRVEGKPRRLTTGLNAQAIALSANGARLAYSVYRSSNNVWKLTVPTAPPVSTAGAVPLTSGDQTTSGLNASADGRWLYFDSDLTGKGQLYRMALPNGAIERLTFDSFDNFAPAVSPDGREVAFHSWRTGSRDIFVMPLAGGALQRATTGPGHEMIPRWSPDGRALAYSDFNLSVFVLPRNADGSWGTPVKRATGFFSAWSPDGKWLAFQSGSHFTGPIVIVPRDAGDSKVVYDPASNNGVEATDPRWSEDGRTIFFRSSDVTGHAMFWSVPSSGGRATLLVRFDDPALQSYWPQWEVNRGALYFNVAERQADVWVMEVLRH